MRTTSVIEALFDNKFALGLLGAVAMALAVYGVVLWQRPAPEPVPAGGRAGSWNDAVGPGLLSGTGGNLPALAMQDMRDVKIAVDSSGHLAPDRALLKLMNEFLVTPRPSERQAQEQQLRTMLHQRLDEPAAGEADRLVTAYGAYLQAESQLLVRERFAQADPNGLSDEQVKHLLAWQRERESLRERMLGTVAATAWFGDEDANCTAALNDWEKQLAPPDDNDSVEQWSRRRNGDRLAARRNEDAQACAARIAESVAAPRG